MADKLRISLALQPATTALFANSSIHHGDVCAHDSWRSGLYLGLDPKRVGMLPFVFSEDFGFESYAEWALDAPMILMYRGGTEVECGGSSFREFMTKGVRAMPGVCRCHEFLFNLCFLPVLWSVLVCHMHAFAS